MNKTNQLSASHKCFCCNFVFSSSYTGKGDKFCATCRKEIKLYYDSIWKETFNNTFQKIGTYKHKIFCWKNNSNINIIVGPQKIKAPDKDTIFYHFVKKIYKYYCCNINSSGCGITFFSSEINNKCPYCYCDIQKNPITRYMICDDIHGNIDGKKIPEIKYLPCIELIDKWAWKHDYPETLFLSEVIMLYVLYENKNINFMYYPNINAIIPKILCNIKKEDIEVGNILIKSESNPSFMNNEELNLTRSMSTATLFEEDEIKSNMKRVMSYRSLDDVPFSAKRMTLSNTNMETDAVDNNTI